MEKYIIYNPYSNRNRNEKVESILKDMIKNEHKLIDITKISCYKDFFLSLNCDDVVIILGGDGTLNRFINDTNNLKLPDNLYYYPAGCGNDFYRDISDINNLNFIKLDKYLINLPTVKVNGKQYKFLNGVGYGIDGYCCKTGDEKRALNIKKINYTTIAIKGLMFFYKPTNAKIIVDGKEYNFKKVWLAPTMKGKYYGGGMIPTPNQERSSNLVSTMVFHGSGKLETLLIFPKIFKGTHVLKTKNVSVFSGKNIKVIFENPRPLQIDGETILDVLEYEVNA